MSSLIVHENDDGSVDIYATPDFAPLMHLRVVYGERTPTQGVNRKSPYIYDARRRYATGWWVIDPKHDWDFGRFGSQHNAMKKALRRARWFIEAYSVDRHVKKQEVS